jgi:hypothetical protein
MTSFRVNYLSVTVDLPAYEGWIACPISLLRIQFFQKWKVDLHGTKLFTYEKGMCVLHGTKSSREGKKERELGSKLALGINQRAAVWWSSTPPGRALPAAKILHCWLTQ